ncbi:hypothetical protein DFJ73DRAFT_781977 [Zopfochytrium polystomum]|nr:hypothetical protein DFJ73DRAFT_781977 [Zopfochytrium polystomum]
MGATDISAVESGLVQPRSGYLSVFNPDLVQRVDNQDIVETASLVTAIKRGFFDPGPKSKLASRPFPAFEHFSVVQPPKVPLTLLIMGSAVKYELAIREWEIALHFSHARRSYLDSSDAGRDQVLARAEFAALTAEHTGVVGAYRSLGGPFLIAPEKTVAGWVHHDYVKQFEKAERILRNLERIQPASAEARAGRLGRIIYNVLEAIVQVRMSEILRRNGVSLEGLHVLHRSDNTPTVFYLKKRAGSAAVHGWIQWRCDAFSLL